MGGCPVGYLHNVVEELDSKLPRTNPGRGRLEDLNSGTSRCQIQRPEPLGTPKGFSRFFEVWRIKFPRKLKEEHS